jgi:hypothetical protein
MDFSVSVISVNDLFISVTSVIEFFGSVISVNDLFISVISVTGFFGSVTSVIAKKTKAVLVRADTAAAWCGTATVNMLLRYESNVLLARGLR